MARRGVRIRSLAKTDNGMHSKKAVDQLISVSARVECILQRRRQIMQQTAENVQADDC